MESSSPIILSTVLFLLISSPWIITTSESSPAPPEPSSCSSFTSIISFGDSIADTGNLVRLVNHNARADHPPYGRTFFHRPTGRFSDGRLIIDFIAESLRMPFVESYIGESNADRFSKGVNFAVAGATALDSSFFEERGVHNSMTNVSLGTQFDWFKQFLASNPTGNGLLENALILFGEIGGNDYNNPFQTNMSPQDVRSFVPTVINCIGSRIQELIELGAKTLVVPGNFPIGCLPIYMTLYESSQKDYYDPETGCIKWLNELSEYHNELLNEELERLRLLYPQTTIVYADYYSSTLRIYRSPGEFGFSRENVFKACCGAGGPYNYNVFAHCGISSAVSCDDPSAFASWDGIHFTEAAYEWIAKGLIEGPYAVPQFKTMCSPSTTMPGISAQ